MKHYTRAAFRRATASDMGSLRAQTALNIRKWGGGRKQKREALDDTRSVRAPRNLDDTRT